MNDSNTISSRATLFRWQGWFYFINSLILLLIGSRYFSLQPWPDDFLPQLFVLLSYPSQFLVMAMSLIIISGLVTLVYPRFKLIQLLSVFLITLMVIIVGIDSVVFELYRFHLNGMVWSLIINGGIFEILPISWLTWVIVAIGIIFLVIVELKLAKIILSWLQTDFKFGVSVSIFSVIILLSAQIIHAWGDANNVVNITKQVRYLPAYKPATMKRFLTQKGFATNTHKVNLPNRKSSLAYPKNAMQCQVKSVADGQKNILIVTIDSWRFDMMTEKATPNIWAFAKKSTNFQKHFSTGNATRFGVFGMFYGIYGTYWHAFLAEEKGPVLIDVLNDNNYDFSIHASARLTSPEFDRTIFSEIRNQIPLKTPGDTAYQRDKQITDDFVSFLKERNEDKPFFGFVFYDSPHGYTYPKSANEPFKPTWKTINHLALNNDFDPVPYRNRFLNSVNYVDGLIKSIIDELETQKLLENTIVIITGDHGEEFNETGLNYWGHNSNFARFQTQVPMIVYWPEKTAGNVTYPTGHTDIVPTLMSDVLECSNPPSDYSLGSDLFSKEHKPYFLISGWDRFALVTDTQIDLIYNAGHVEKFDLNYHPFSSAKSNSKIMTQALNDMSQFYDKSR